MAVSEKFDLVIRAKDEASATLGRINGEVNRLATGAVPNVTKSADGMTGAFARAELKAALLGTRIAGINPIVGQFANVLAFGNPLIGIAAAGVGLLAASFLDADEPTAKYVSTLMATNEQLAKLAAGTDLVAQKAGFLKGARLSDLKAEEQKLVADIAAINTTKTIAKEYDRLGGITAEQTRQWNDQRMEADNLRLRLEDLNARLATNRENQAKLTSEDTKAADAAAKLTEETRKLIEANDRLNASTEEGFTVVSKYWRERAAFMDAQSERAGKSDMDSLSNVFDYARGVWQSQASESDKLRQESERNFDAFANQIHGTMTNAANDLVGIMFGVRTSFADIFKGMAQDFLSFFISAITQKFAQKAASSLLSFIPGVGPFLGIAAGGLGKPSAAMAGGGGLDIGAAGAGRFPSGKASAASVTVVIQGPVIGEDEYVRNNTIPSIERAIAYGQSKLVMR